jgi:putative ABC transport system permease protein
MNATPRLQPTGLRWRDLLGEVAATVTTRPGRSLLTAVGTVLGVGTLIAVVGLASTAAGQVSSRFDALADVTVTITDSRDPADIDAPFPFDATAIDQARGLNGVEGAGMVYLPNTNETITSPHPDHHDQAQLPIMGVSPGLWDVIEPTLAAGRLTDQWLDHQQVAVLGASAAARLQITATGALTTIEIGGRPFVVAGIIKTTTRRADLLNAVMIPASTVIDLWGEPTILDQAEMMIITRPGAAGQVAREAPTAISPLNPSAVTATPPPDPRTLRDSINTDLTGLLYAMGAITLLIGTVGIANTTLVAVMERQSEFGIRRALGARRRDIAVQIAVESAALGGLGGILGTAAGLLALVTISLLRQWGPIINPLLLLIAPTIGIITGILAGLYPAIKATNIEPTQALRPTT